MATTIRLVRIVENGNFEEFELFCRDHKDLIHEFYWAIELATMYNRLDIVKFWHKNDFEEKFRNNHLLVGACRHGSYDVAQYLLQNMRWTSDQLNEAIIEACGDNHF